MIRVGIALVRKDGRYLIRRRPDVPGSPMPGYWEFPGGKCEQNEAPEQAAARECHEESGIEVEIRALRRVITHYYQHGHVQLHYFDCFLKDGDAEPLARSGFRWIAASELERLTFPEANEPILEELARERENR